MIDDVRANVSQVDETLESNLEEENNEENEDARMHEHLTSSGEVPDNLKEAENPAYEVGSEAIIEAEHSDEGYLMRGAEATIVGAYDTTAYSVSFTPKTGGEPVENHKWVIHEELEEPDEAPLQPESEVTLKASHMVGMYNTKATIDSAEETTVYMINFTSPSGEEKVENHKWVIEKELALVE
ncbi:YdhK family protein [Bacillus aidingensis]